MTNWDPSDVEELLEAVTLCVDAVSSPQSTKAKAARDAIDLMKDRYRRGGAAPSTPEE